MSDAVKKESCTMCGKKGAGLVMDATFHEDSSKIRGAMKKIFAALGLPEEDIGLVVFVLEKPQTLCSSCHSSMHTLLALQGEVTALEGSMRKYAVQGFGEAIRNSLGKEQNNRPSTPSDGITDTIMWTKFQLPVLQNFTSGRIRVPSQDAEDASEDEDEDEEDSSSSHSSPRVVVVKEEELEEGEVRETSGKRTAKNSQEKAPEEMDNRPGTEPKIPVSVVSTTEERETDTDRTERRGNSFPRLRNRSREADKRKRNRSRESENDKSKKLKEDETPSTSSVSSTPSNDRESSITVASSEKPGERGRSPGRRGKSPCGWIVVFGHTNSSSRREKRREWRCQRSCSLNIAENRGELRRSLMECRGRTVKSYGFVPEREEETRERGERRRMGGRCVVRGCHASGDWFDVPGLLGHIHGENHIKGMIGNASK